MTATWRSREELVHQGMWLVADRMSKLAIARADDVSRKSDGNLAVADKLLITQTREEPKGSMQFAGMFGGGIFGEKQDLVGVVLRLGRGHLSIESRPIYPAKFRRSPDRSMAISHAEPMPAIVGAWMPELATRRSALRAVTYR